jgi:LacI family transcriptional regulator
MEFQYFNLFANKIGIRAAEYLLARIAGEPTPPSVEVPIGLMVRDTTGPAPHSRR